MQFYRKNYHVIPVQYTGANLILGFPTGSEMLSPEQANVKYVVISDTPVKGRAVRRHAPVYVAQEYGGRMKLIDVFGRVRRVDSDKFRRQYRPLHPAENEHHNTLTLPLQQPATFDIDY